jgi:hypothetical protein
MYCLVYQTTRYRIPEDNNFRTRRSENFIPRLNRFLQLFCWTSTAATALRLYSQIAFDSRLLGILSQCSSHFLWYPSLLLPVTCENILCGWDWSPWDTYWISLLPTDSYLRRWNWACTVFVTDNERVAERQRIRDWLKDNWCSWSIYTTACRRE